MRNAALILIGLGLLVVVAGQTYLSWQTEPERPVVANKTTLRNTESGAVVGFIDKLGARSWQGIPYAEPPVGQLRWRAPQPPIPSQTPIEALQPGAICPQFASLLSGADEQTPSGQIAGNEDCLYLNIWSPPNAAKLPVMLWIHGGGNTIGHAGSYNGAALATQRNVVIVTINYRLGIFGWFSHPDLLTGDKLDDSGNYGTLDVVRALEWVQSNIEVFGGDPGNVTVFGESAGAFDTLAMMASPLAKGLFHRAIVQSGGFSPTNLDRAQNYQEDGGAAFSSRELVTKMLITDGLATNREAAKNLAQDMRKTELRDYLYAKTPAQFFAQLDGGGFGMIPLPDNFGDGHVLPDLSTEEIFSDPNNHNQVPVILGTNRDEPSLFMVRAPQYVENWLGLLPRLKDEDAYKRAVYYGAQAWKHRGVDSLANYMSRSGNEQVYAYRFDWDEEPSQFGFDLSVALGAAHGLEIAFAFNDFEGGMGLGYIYPGNKGQYALAASMSSYWTQFAYTGNPSQGRDSQETQWLSWGTEGKRSLILDTLTDQGIFMDDQEVVLEALQQELIDDPNITDPQERCNLYRTAFRAAPDNTKMQKLCAGS
ncbi:MAG: carboxylesterase [Gammaproteobacteria bacterium]|nr:carboxylesterase [Gammaproteobacteria bacterium]